MLKKVTAELTAFLNNPLTQQYTYYTTKGCNKIEYSREEGVSMGIARFFLEEEEKSSSK